MKIEINKLTNVLILYYPVIYILFAFFSDGLARKISIGMIIILAAKILHNKNKKQICFLFIMFILTAYNIIIYGLNYVVHQDFYGYILFLLICITYARKIDFLELDALCTYKNIIQITSLFIFVIMISIFWGGGLQKSTEWGTSMPLLYGPYELPHSLAYQLIIMYMYSSVGAHKYKKKVFFAYMALFSGMLIWTGVRSAFLALVVLLFFEYSSIRKVNIKLAVVMGGVVLMIYLYAFTNFFQNNPIIQKTVQALSQASGISNGRTDFNSYLSNIYLYKMNFFEKIFGIGIDKLRSYMYLRYATALHAHNDIFNTLLGMGIIGLYIYIKALFQLCKINGKWGRVFISIAILAFTNGVFMYTAFTPCIPIFVEYFNELDKVKELRTK